MGREIKRTPIGFDWKMNETWWGYLLDTVSCQTCNGNGKTPNKIIQGFLCDDGTWHTFETQFCPTCEGEGMCRPRVEVPKGPGYQLWETVTEGSPISPSLEHPEELARWLADSDDKWFSGWRKLSYETWLSFIKDSGWAPSFVADEKGIRSGVEFMADH